MEGNKLAELAKDVLILSRNTLLVNLRFLDMALSQFTYHEIEDGTLMTDGKYLIYAPKHILRCYKSAKEIPVRDYLHIVMHCVFRHMFMDPTLNSVYWDLACDIAVENAITELSLKSVATHREQAQTPYIDAIKKDLGMVTAEKIYFYLRTTYPDPNKLSQIRRLFYADNHEIWYMTEDRKKAAYSLPCSGASQSEGTQKDGNGVSNAIAAEWQKISERMQVDMETFGKQRGTLPGGLTQNLQAVNREKYDYTEFLKKFAVLNEAMRVNDDEFDYIFYTYGLQLYGKMPLIEPLEYKEVKQIREFVIAIDTSSSTSGELVQKFVQKTYNILKSTESFCNRINLHIIQCDEDIQEAVKITNQEEFDQYLQNMTIKGLGGTDFRPVFSYVDKLIHENEFTNLKGLLYFTDGCGTFPEKMPPYQTAFVFIDDEYNNPDVPPWAVKVVLQKDEI